jgi:hypothetical protein
MSRGWSSAGLKAVGDDDTLWTARDAARLLGPPELPPEKVRWLIAIAELEPVGKRRTTAYGRSGRYARVYAARDFIEAYEALSRRRAA